MLYMRIITVCSEINRHHRNAFCVQNTEFVLTLNLVAHKDKRLDFAGVILVKATAKFHIHSNMHSLQG
jgi:hypothetical protein